MTATFLEETVEAIRESGHEPGDIIFIGSQESGHCCTWDEFCVLADRYCCSCEVATDLKIVFSDGQSMWRLWDDRDEHWWEYASPFVEPPERKPIRSLFDLWAKLAAIPENREAR